MFTGLLDLFNYVLDMFPDANYSIPNDITDGIIDIINASAYFLPLSDLFAIFIAYMVVVNFHLIWVGVTKVWAMLPFT